MKDFTNKYRLPVSGRKRLMAVLLGGLLLTVIFALAMDGTRNQTGEKAKNLVFSEICTKNEGIIADNDGRYRDYIELYNGGEDINLQGYYITDGGAKSKPFGDMPLPKGTYCLLFLDKELTGFSLKATGGECVSLMDAAGRIVAQATTMPMAADQVMLYTPSDYVVSSTATPGFSNDKTGVQAFEQGTKCENPILLISEMLTENKSSLPDDAGRFSDVVELYNGGTEPLYLGDYCLSDSQDARFRYRLPSRTLEAGAYAVIYCDGENYIGENGEIHANFALSQGDTLCLTDREGGYVCVPVQFPGEDTSLSRNSDGKYEKASVSLGYANDETGAASFAASRMDNTAELVVSEVLLSASQVPYQGSFVDAVEIWNRTDKAVDTANWYLSDGGDPYTFPLPQQKLKPGERLVVPCSRETTGFALSQGETLCLLSPNWKWASKVFCAGNQPGQSIQIVEQTGESTYTSGAVSLGYANTEAGTKFYEQDRMPDGLRISEVMSANQSYLKGPYGSTWDWVELYNGGNKAVNLKDYTFSTNADKINAHPLPDKTLAAGQYCVILLSDRSDSYPKGYGRLPANLSADGDGVYLSRGGEVVDYAIVPALPTDIAYGRATGNTAFSCLIPTPEASNGAQAPLSETPQAVTAQGTYEADVQVTLSGKGNIYYTTDCTVPTAESTLYTGPIHLTKTTVIRAISCEAGKLPSQIADLTYVVKEGHALPVVSLVTTPDNLWDYHTGIYVEGPNASATSPHWGANYHQNWEKTATVSLFEKDGTGFSEPCGISIFGAYSRALPMKAFDIAFRDYYGAGSLNYPLFGEKGLDRYENFILRCSGQDAQVARMRDVLMTSLVADQTTVAVQKYRPVVLYLNGEFWGVYYIREKANENYVAGNYNAKAEDVSLTEFNGNTEYKKLVDYAHTHDLTQQEHYDYVCAQMDVENYIDFMVAQMYIANTDIDNIKFFKTSDLKWTWLFYDTDLAFSSSGYDTVKDYTNPSGTGGGGALSTKLINALLKNSTFRDAFIRRIAWQMNNIWSVENVTARVNELEGLIAEDMKRDCQKWGRSYTGWQGSVDFLRKFPQVRNQKLPTFVQSYFGLTDQQMREYGFPTGG